MPTLACPICRCSVSYASLSEIPYRPFCSRRCKLIDLGRWLNEEYRISEELPHGESSEGERPDKGSDAAGDEASPPWPDRDENVGPAD